MFYKITQAHFEVFSVSVGFNGCLFGSPFVFISVFNGRTSLINSQNALSTLYFVFADVSINFIPHLRAFSSASSGVILRLSAKSTLFPINIAGKFEVTFFTRKICSLKKKQDSK